MDPNRVVLNRDGGEWSNLKTNPAGIYVGLVKLWHPIEDFTPNELEQIADCISSIAADIKKGQAGNDSRSWSVRILKPDHSTFLPTPRGERS